MALISQGVDAPMPAGVTPAVHGWPVTLTPRTIWTSLAIIGGTALTVFIVSEALGALLLVFIAIVFAEGIRPIVNVMRRAHIPRPVGALIIYLVGGTLFASLLWVLVQPVASDAATLANALPTYDARLQQTVNQVQQTLAASPTLQHAIDLLGTQAANQLSNGVPTLLGVPFTFLQGIVSAILVLTLSLFWLTATDALTPFLLSLLPADQEDYARETIRQVRVQLGGYLRGVVVNMVVIGTVTGVGLYLLGVPYAALLGLIAGATEVLPIVGPWISGSVAVLVALLTGGLVRGIEVVAFFAVLQQLEGNTLVPLVMSRTARVHPFTVLLALIVGEALLGIVGAVLAVPAAIVVQVLVARVIAPLARAASGRPDPKADLKADLEADLEAEAG